MNARQTLTAVMIAVAGFVSPAMGDGVRLAKDGKPCARIVVAMDADKVARFAAQELKYHLDRMVGGRFEIATERDGRDAPRPGEVDILVGLGPHTGLGRDDFKMQEWTVDASENFIQSVVPCATVHTTDRLGKIALEK